MRLWQVAVADQAELNLVFNFPEYAIVRTIVVLKDVPLRF